VPLGSKEDAMLEASLIIPAHNEESRLPGTLAIYGRGMREQFGENFEIVVVANGCADGTVTVAKEAAMEIPGSAWSRSRRLWERAARSWKDFVGCGERRSPSQTPTGRPRLSNL
jgi:cellulose synthase/poly-beta-1,6-N-acetylglucosamine synthase-like glycosyltransferase